MSKNLFIASGIFHPESGGPATYLYELLPALQERGWEIRALSYGKAETASYPYPLTRVPRRALPLRLSQYAQAALPLARWADLIYLHTLGLPVYGGGSAPRLIKIVGDQAWERSIRRGWIPPTTDIDSFQEQDFGPVVRLQKAIRAREVQRAYRVIVPSEYLRRMVQGWGVDPARIHLIYNALPSESESTALSPEAARTRLGLDDGPYILTAGRLHVWKGVDHLLRALAELPDLKLLVAGDGPMRAALEQQMADLQLQDRVRFLGRLPRQELVMYMKAVDYFVLYSSYEGLSHVILESLRAGTPVIASDRGGNPEEVEHEFNGLLIPYGDVDGLAETLRAAFRPGKREALAANTTIGISRFAFSRMITQTDGLLKDCLRSD